MLLCSSENREGEEREGMHEYDKLTLFVDSNSKIHDPFNTRNPFQALMELGPV
jgi:hypothetical protein